MGLAGSLRELLERPGAVSLFEKIEFDYDDEHEHERIVARFLKLP